MTTPIKENSMCSYDDEKVVIEAFNSLLFAIIVACFITLFIFATITDKRYMEQKEQIESLVLQVEELEQKLNN